MDQGFTNDLSAQILAVDRFKAALQARYPSPRSWPYDYKASLSKLRNVVQTLADSPHARRAVLFVAEGLLSVKHGPSPPPGNELAGLVEMADLFEAARRANIPVYTIDPRSLLPISGEPFDRQFERGEQETLRELATNTGGRAFVDRPKMGSAVEEILTDHGSFYVLRFTPDPLVRDGKLHPIEVRVKRPDVRIRARGGYVAAGPGT